MRRAAPGLQPVVEAAGVQTASNDSKPTSVASPGLVGLYLRVERQFSGSAGSQAGH